MLEFKKDTLKFGGIYRGLVMDNTDPDKLGRLCIKVYPMFEGVETEFLPWATPAMPLFEGAGAGYGCLAIPKVGSFVFVFFEAGDVYQPVYFAEAQTAGRGLPASAIGDDYPNVKSWRTQSGIEIRISNSEIRITHPENASLVIDENGGITITGTSVDINPSV